MEELDFGGEHEEELDEALEGAGQTMYLAIRLEVRQWLSENSGDILQAIMDGVREGTLEFLEDLKEKHPYLFSLRPS